MHGRRTIADKAPFFLAASAFAALGLAGAAAACSATSGGTSPHDGGAGDARDARVRDSALRDGRQDTSSASDAGDASVPELTELSVTSTSPAEGGPGVALVPAFSPAIHDYYVRCAAGLNALTISMTAATGATSVLFLPTPAASAPKQTVSLTVAENEAIVAAATNGVATTEYWVRCLPHDMPELEWTTYPEAGAPTPGYYLAGNLFPGTQAGGYAMVIDTHGVPVWYAGTPNNNGAYDVNNVIPGAIAFLPLDPTGRVKGSFEIDQLKPLVRTSVSANGYTMNIHELQVTAAGTYLVFSLPLVYGVDLTGLRMQLLDGTWVNLGKNSTIQDCSIIEFSADGSVVSTWSGTDHFDPAKDSTFPEPAYGGQSSPDGGILVDPFHCNSIDIDPKNGNLLISARNMDSVFYIERPSGKVLWKMGGAPYSTDGATYVKVDQPFFRQHDARLGGWDQGCNGGTGQVSVFDDETAKPANARGILYDVVVGAPDGGGGGGCDGGTPDGGHAPGNATTAWQVQGSGPSRMMGSVRIYPDGARVVGWGAPHDPGLILTEVDPAGNHTVDLHFNNAAFSYRAIKIPLSAFELQDLRTTAGLP